MQYLFSYVVSGTPWSVEEEALRMDLDGQAQVPDVQRLVRRTGEAGAAHSQRTLPRDDRVRRQPDDQGPERDALASIVRGQEAQDSAAHFAQDVR